MRVVQVANFYGPRSGGLRTAVDRLGAEYCAAGHEVFLVVPGRYPEWRRLPSGVVRICLPARLIPLTGGYRAVLPGPVTSLLERLAPDALEVSDRLTLRSLGGWGHRHDVATVMISHERLDRLVGQILPARIARTVADVANRRTAASYDAVVCTTAFAREEFDRIHAPNVVTVPLGVDLDQFHPCRRSAVMRQRWAGPDQTLLVHCGRLSVEKHAHRSIDTIAALRNSGVDARLVVVGEGPLRARLERQAARLPVDFTGYIGCRDTVATILASADVALAPGPHETFGLAALEALACGTPAVVSRTSALAEILTTDSGATADNDPHAIASAVTSIITRPERLRRSSARRRAEHISPGPGRPPECSTRWRGTVPHTRGGYLGPVGGPRTGPIPSERRGHRRRRHPPVGRSRHLATGRIRHSEPRTVHCRSTGGPVNYHPEMVRCVAVLPAVMALAVTGVAAAGIANAEPTPPCSFTLSPPQVVQVSGTSLVTATVSPAGCEVPASPHQSVACLQLQGGDSAGQCMNSGGIVTAQVYYSYRPGATYVSTGRGCASTGNPPRSICQVVGPFTATL